MNQKLSIVVPVYNQAKHTEKMLDSLVNIKVEHEIIVIDNGSDRQTVELLNKYENIVRLRFPVNQFVTKAWNVGVSIARWEYILVCNNDIIIPEYADLRMIEEYDGRIVSPMIKNVWQDVEIRHDTNINGTCWLMKREDWKEDIPETMKIWYNDNWLFHAYGTKWIDDVVVTHIWSATVNSFNHNPITSQDREEFIKIKKEKWW